MSKLIIFLLKRKFLRKIFAELWEDILPLLFVIIKYILEYHKDDMNVSRKFKQLVHVLYVANSGLFKTFVKETNKPWDDDLVYEFERTIEFFSKDHNIPLFPIPDIP